LGFPLIAFGFCSVNFAPRTGLSERSEDLCGEKQSSPAAYPRPVEVLVVIEDALWPRWCLPVATLPSHKADTTSKLYRFSICTNQRFSIRADQFRLFLSEDQFLRLLCDLAVAPNNSLNKWIGAALAPWLRKSLVRKQSSGGFVVLDKVVKVARHNARARGIRSFDFSFVFSNRSLPNGLCQRAESWSKGTQLVLDY